MISRDKAHQLVEKQLKKIELDGRYLVDKDRTSERHDCWVVFYNSEAFLKTRDDNFALIGNGPFLVDKQTGEIESVSSSEDVEGFIDDFL